MKGHISPLMRRILAEEARNPEFAAQFRKAFLQAVDNPQPKSTFEFEGKTYGLRTGSSFRIK